MKIVQKNIFGQENPEISAKEKLNGAKENKFPMVSLSNGLKAEAEGDAVLVHRILEKKMIYGKLSSKKQRKIFAQILKNELLIKSGKLDPMTATRDSLLLFFTTKR